MAKYKYYGIQNFLNSMYSGDLKVGDKVKITDMYGEATFVVVHIMKKTGTVYLLRKWLICLEQPLIDDKFNSFEWLKSQYQQSLPKEIQEQIVGDVTLPSREEIFGSEIVKPLKYFRSVTHRVSAKSREAEGSEMWWTRTHIDSENISMYAFIGSAGNCTGYNPSSAYWMGLRPLIVLNVKR